MGKTKEQSDIATAIVISDLVSGGCQVFVPLGENSPVDLICVTPSGNPVRLQVRSTRSKRVSGKPVLRLANVLYRAGGGHKKVVLDKSKFDFFVVVCFAKSYYIPVSDVPDQTCEWSVEEKYGRLPDW
jgi:hypothetical protein